MWIQMKGEVRRNWNKERKLYEKNLFLRKEKKSAKYIIFFASLVLYFYFKD